jgi:hypothetical protein
MHTRVLCSSVGATPVTIQIAKNISGLVTEGFGLRSDVFRIDMKRTKSNNSQSKLLRNKTNLPYPLVIIEGDKVVSNFGLSKRNNGSYLSA